MPSTKQPLSKEDLSMHSNCTRKLLGLEDILIKNVIQADSFVRIYIETKPSTQTCPHCGKQTKRIHDYRSQTIKDLPFQLKHTYLVLRKRRYSCSCGKRFLEKYTFLAPYKRRTLRLSYKIIDLLRNLRSMKSVAVVRMFPLVPFPGYWIPSTTPPLLFLSASQLMSLKVIRMLESSSVFW